MRTGQRKMVLAFLTAPRYKRYFSHTMRQIEQRNWPDKSRHLHIAQLGAEEPSLLLALRDLLTDPSRKTQKMRRLCFPLLRLSQIGDLSTLEGPEKHAHDLERVKAYFSPRYYPWWADMVLVTSSGGTGIDAAPRSSSNLSGALSRIQTKRMRKFFAALAAREAAVRWLRRDSSPVRSWEETIRIGLKYNVHQFCNAALAKGATEALAWYAKEVTPMLEVLHVFEKNSGFFFGCPSSHI